MNGWYDDSWDSTVSYSSTSYVHSGSVAANTWRKVSIPLGDISGSNRVITGIMIQDDTGGVQPRYYIDDMQFVGTVLSSK